MVADASRDQVARSVYDKAGREVYAIDALGGVVQRQFDANGRVLTGSGALAMAPLSGASWTQLQTTSDGKLPFCNCAPSFPVEARIHRVLN